MAQSRIPESVESTSRSIERLTEKLNPAVVEIAVKAWEVDDSTENPEHAGYVIYNRYIGSGVLLTQSGEILTNHHVIQGAQQITVHLLGSKKGYNATIVGDDPETDLALLKIEGTGLPCFELRAASEVKQGQIVLALGSPFGLGHSITLGVVSSPSRDLGSEAHTTYIQTDAPLNPGNSGGPLVDLEGHLVGINTLILSYSGASEGVGFAIPIETVIPAVAAMEKFGSLKSPYLGVSFQPVTETLANGLRLGGISGLLVDDVDPSSPASESGLKPGDVILVIQGRVTAGRKSLQDALNSLHVGQSLGLTIERKRRQISIDIKPRYDLAVHQELMDYVNIATDSFSPLGIIAITLNDSVRPLIPTTRAAEGALIIAKCESTRYDADELEAGDILLQINGHSIHDSACLRLYLSLVDAQEPLVVQIERSGHLKYVAMTSQD